VKRRDLDPFFPVPKGEPQLFTAHVCEFFISSCVVNLQLDGGIELRNKLPSVSCEPSVGAGLSVVSGKHAALSEAKRIKIVM